MFGWDDMRIAQEIILDGFWEAGTDRRYDRAVRVPGLAGDPRKMQDGTLWYRRRVSLPPGGWTHATLILNGARFCPAVHINGRLVSACPGGMTVTTHLLRHEDVRPGGEISLEIALKSLRDVDPGDASRIPEADLWRSNISSCLWDTVRLRVHGPARLTRIIPFPSVEDARLDLRFAYEDLTESTGERRVLAQLLDRGGRRLSSAETDCVDGRGLLRLGLHGEVKPWSPEEPHCHRLRVTLSDAEGLLDVQEMNFGLKDFRVDGLGFRLNGSPFHLRAGTVVWHRWLRDPEARELAFDTEWFARNIVLRLKSHGANGLRFHLGTPPEAFLDLCDRHGLLVQAEWLFFHGMKATRASLLAQWRSWLDLCLRHPSVCLIHPWNETAESELALAQEAVEALAPEYPPLVISHRDVIHIHKYWWSLFENVGLYYDSASQFPKPIVADEFGGNYLDGAGDPGGYPTVRETFLRFLGRAHDKQLRLELQTEANTQIAEYWRRLGAAGFSPFCALGSPEDGNHHFLGPLREAMPKPVWAGLTAAYSPLSCSLEVWDRDFVPGQRVTLPLHLMNDTDADADLAALVTITPEYDPSPVQAAMAVEAHVEAHSMRKREVSLTLPASAGRWRFRATLQNPPATVSHPVESSWRFRTIAIEVPPALRDKVIGVPDGEPELRDFLSASGLAGCDLDDPRAGILLTSAASWERLQCDRGFVDLLGRRINEGCSLLMLDVGPAPLGQGYAGGLGPLQGRRSVADPQTWEAGLFHGVRLAFRELPEPESCIHPAAENDDLWEGLDRQYTWLWNGYRGGLIAPAVEMEPGGMSRAAFLALWTGRGADPALIQGGKGYYAYELAGFHAFSRERGDETEQALRARVRFLVEDAPALAVSIDPEAPIKVSDLCRLYAASAHGKATALIPLANCGKGLTRVPVVRIDFAPGMGRLIVSQLLTGGRLAPGYGQEGLYGVRYDPAAAQFVLNMVKQCVLPLPG